MLVKLTFNYVISDFINSIILAWSQYHFRVQQNVTNTVRIESNDVATHLISTHIWLLTLYLNIYQSRISRTLDISVYQYQTRIPSESFDETLSANITFFLINIVRGYLFSIYIFTLTHIYLCIYNTKYNKIILRLRAFNNIVHAISLLKLNSCHPDISTCRLSWKLINYAS